MASRLADETLELILAQALKIPDERFLDVFGSQFSSIARRQNGNSAVLLVCKRWMRIATPLPYDTVILRSIYRAQVLFKTLVKVPDCALFVKRLRIEGGHDVAVGMILRAATHLRDLHISLRLKAMDDVGAMCEALPAVNPSRLILSVSPFSPSSTVVHIRRENIVTYDEDFTEKYLLKHAKQLVIHRDDDE